MAAIQAKIRVGIGGWVFAPWRGTFYPPKLKQASELDFASRQLTSIEINGTFYGAQKPASFQRWYRETPDDFVFSVKGTRYATYRTELGEAGPSVDRFFTTGVLELKEKLGPVLWQLPATAKFAPARLDAFLKLLPAELDGQRIRHALVEGATSEGSFATKEALELMRNYGVAAPWVDSDGREMIEEITADFVYARLRGAIEEEPTGYAPKALQGWSRSSFKLTTGRHQQIGLYDQWRQGARPGGGAGADRKLV